MQPVWPFALHPADLLSDPLLLWLSQQLSEDELALLLLSLRLRRSAAQLVKLRGGHSVSSQAFEALTMWRRGLPAATQPAKACQLAQCLASSGRPDLARELLLRQAAQQAALAQAWKLDIIMTFTAVQEPGIAAGLWRWLLSSRCQHLIVRFLGLQPDSSAGKLLSILYMETETRRVCFHKSNFTKKFYSLIFPVNIIRDNTTQINNDDTFCECDRRLWIFRRKYSLAH